MKNNRILWVVLALGIVCTITTAAEAAESFSGSFAGTDNAGAKMYFVMEDKVGIRLYDQDGSAPVPRNYWEFKDTVILPAGQPMNLRVYIYWDGDQFGKRRRGIFRCPPLQAGKEYKLWFNGKLQGGKITLTYADVKKLTYSSKGQPKFELLREQTIPPPPKDVPKAELKNSAQPVFGKPNAYIIDSFRVNGALKDNIIVYNRTNKDDISFRVYFHDPAYNTWRRYGGEVKLKEPSDLADEVPTLSSLSGKLDMFRYFAIEALDGTKYNYRFDKKDNNLYISVSEVNKPIIPVFPKDFPKAELKNYAQPPIENPNAYVIDSFSIKGGLKNNIIINNRTNNDIPFRVYLHDPAYNLWRRNGREQTLKEAGDLYDEVTFYSRLSKKLDKFRYFAIEARDGKKYSYNYEKKGNNLHISVSELNKPKIPVFPKAFPKKELKNYAQPVFEKPNVYIIDSFSAKGNLKDYSILYNRTTKSNISFKVYLHDPTYNIWKKYGEVVLAKPGDQVQISSRFSEKLDMYRYFAIEALDGNNYSYSFNKKGNDLHISIADK